MTVSYLEYHNLVKHTSTYFSLSIANKTQHCLSTARENTKVTNVSHQVADSINSYNRFPFSIKLQTLKLTLSVLAELRSSEFTSSLRVFIVCTSSGSIVPKLPVSVHHSLQGAEINDQISDEGDTLVQIKSKENSLFFSVVIALRLISKDCHFI